MPLKPGKSRRTISENIREFHEGKTYRSTARKFGKKKADKQAIAVAMRSAGKSKSSAKRKKKSNFWG